MADDEFIDLEEQIDEKFLAQAPKEVEEKLESQKNNKLLYILIILLLVAIFVLGGLFFYLYSKKKEEASQKQEINATKIVDTIEEKERPQEENSKVQRWLKEAEILYNEGKKEEALKRYQQISLYNRSLSFFNIGVAKLKEKKYKEAMEAFDKASFDNNLKCESALNSAVCAYNLGDKQRFQKYLNLAQKYLSLKEDSPLYSYYKGLIDYYKNAYIETLVAINQPTSNYYKREQYFIGAKIYTSFESMQNAITMLEKAQDPKNFFTLGLLYGNIGEYKIASDYLQKAIEINDHVPQAKMALAQMQNKLGNLNTSAKLLEELDQKIPNATELYPIKVKLKSSLFDPIIAQNEFKKRLFLDKLYKFSLLFYYAPYKLSLNPNVITDLKKGATKIDIDKTASALTYLNNSKNIAQVDIDISEGIKLTLSHKLYEAQEILKEALKKYPWDATLHYNLGLTYAQMFDFKNAYESFSRSAALDVQLFEAAMFKSFCAHLTNKDPKIDNLQQVYDYLSTLTDEAYIQRISALINLAKDIPSIADGYLAANTSPFDHAINLVISYERSDAQAYKESAIALKKLIPEGIVSNILYIDAFGDKREIKKYAKEIQHTLTQGKLDFKPLYYGETLPREMYISMLNIAGISHILLEKLLKQEPKYHNQIAFKQTLALTALYAKKPQLSYKLYNSLIDDDDQKDTHTLFLAAVAAIAGDHNANAIALLELSKLTDSSNFESRYALGLLYQEAKNLRGAVIQYKKIGDSGFQSNYFTFYINNKNIF